MKVHLKKLCLRLILLCTVVLLAVTAASAEEYIRAGLYYGNNALPTANLANETGSGYRLGYYDSKYQFITVGTTAETKITVCKDKNLYKNGTSFQETMPLTSGRLIGAYHLQLGKAFATFEEASMEAGKYPYGFPAYADGSYVVRFEFYSTLENAAKDQDKYPDTTVVGGSTTCYTVIKTETADILFEFDVTGKAAFGILPDLTGIEEPHTWFKGYQYCGGFQYDRRNGNDLSVINIVPTDLYVAGVLPCEFVCTGGVESLKAGAVAIRTFAASTSKHRALGFDVCTTTDCQVYHGVFSGSLGAKARDAAIATTGERLFYKGGLIQALFYASNGGATEAASNTWGYPYDYLIAQEDPYEESITFDSQSWSYTVTPSQIKKVVQAAGYSCAEIVSMEVTELTPIGNVNRVVIRDSNGKTIQFTKDSVRFLQNVPGVTYFSRRFSITPIDEGATASDKMPVHAAILSAGEKITSDSMYAITDRGTIPVSSGFSVLTDAGTVSYGAGTTRETASNITGWKLTGRGFGHNVGLSQWGAYAMAEQGFSYDKILQFYYPGTTIS